MGDYGRDPQAQQCAYPLEMRSGFCSSKIYKNNTPTKALRPGICFTGDGPESRRTSRVMVLHGKKSSCKVLDNKVI